MTRRRKGLASVSTVRREFSLGVAGKRRLEDKIQSLEALAQATQTLRQQGKKIVLCHGVFDLFHIGHLRHLNAAREHGDVLVVSITADQYVNKGPDRPAFPSELRAELLAALEVVDYVAVVEEPSAAAAIRAVQPHAFVKGGEYEDTAKDITGKIVAEKELVEQFAGKVIFTHDITFSSSNLLNKFFALHDESARNYLAKLNRNDIEQRLAALFRKLEDKRILVVGETIIDRYVYVDAMGKAAKENIIATLHRDEEIFAGGAIATANYLAALCPNVELLTLVGDPARGDNHESFCRAQLDPSIKPTFLHRADGPTVQKTRFVEPTYVRKLFEIYNMDDRPLRDSTKKEFNSLLAEKLHTADVAIVCDFGHGLIDADAVRTLEAQARFLAVNAQSNAGNIGFNLINKYGRADLICIDAMEARLAARDKNANLSDLVGNRLSKLIDCDNIIVTHGRAGCFVRVNGSVAHIPSFAGAVVDTVGAGDAFFAIAAPCVSVGADCELAGFVGNIAGAIKVGIVGHRRYLTRLELQRYILTLLK
jgi:rfaE bifunctional protein nucleotidyltransferase chain/domain